MPAPATGDRPRRAYAIHDGLINEWGVRVLESMLAAEAARLGADIRRPVPGESVEIRPPGPTGRRDRVPPIPGNGVRRVAVRRS